MEKVPSTSRRRPLWRACARRHGQPWWFSTRSANLEPGRFDLLASRGTCYWALTPAAAIIETTADPDQDERPVLTIGALSGLSVWRAVNVRQARSKLADMTRASVPALTMELGTVVPYTLPWAWADAFDAHGRNGVVYVARFAVDESVALFGLAGIPDKPWPTQRMAAIEHFDDLPAGFRAGVGTVGNLDELPRASAP